MSKMQRHIGVHMSDDEMKLFEGAETGAFKSPIPTQVISNGEWNAPPQSAQQKQVENLIDEGGKTGKLMGLSTIYRANVPQLYIDIDRKECMTREIALKDVFDTMQVYLGSFYVNDFNLFGRTWQVVLQADYPYRDQVEDVHKL